jgi:formate--tetrahydrofolate ligase
MRSDVEIANSVTGLHIREVAEKLGLREEELFFYGNDKAKVDLSVLDGPRRRPGKGKLILVSALTPTPAGEGKTTTTIGLGQAFGKLGESACLALREPSLGPCMGMKGGATGGGYSQIIPADQINLHFTGDFHAITAANNLLAAMLDNHIHFASKLEINPRKILWRRALDVNDRVLRNTLVGLGGVMQIMAVFCLATGYEDFRRRLDRTLLAFTFEGETIRPPDLKTTGAIMALLKDALMPNLVQTLEGTPAFVHGGPFANIAHGCNSVLATQMAMHLADWTLTEAGFGFDLGAEKFFDIKCVKADLDPSAVVLIATIRALKMHGGASLKELEVPNPEAVRRGLPNLAKHVENIDFFNLPSVVALNKFGTDTDEEIEMVRAFCAEKGVAFAVTDHFARGGDGATDLAKEVIKAANLKHHHFTPLYERSDSVKDKIRAVATKMYGAKDVIYTKAAERDLKDVERLGYADLPICIAKTQSSLSDDPKLRGRPVNFEVTVRNIRINAGAGFLVVLTGSILRMPGLPRHPAAEQIDLVDGIIVGLR